MSDLRELETEVATYEDPVFTVPEMAEEIGASDTHTRDLLRLLERSGVVESKQVGARAVAWWCVERVDPPLVAPEDHPDQEDIKVFAESEADESAERAPRDGPGDVEADGPVDVEDVVADVDISGYGDVREDRREAIAFMLRHLRDAGRTKGSQLQSVVHGNADTGYQTAESFWKNCGQPALKDLRDRGVVELVDEAGGVWGWSG